MHYVIFRDFLLLLNINLFRSYCSSISGCLLWLLSDSSISTFYTAWWTGLRRIVLLTVICYMWCAEWWFANFCVNVLCCLFIIVSSKSEVLYNLFLGMELCPVNIGPRSFFITVYYDSSLTNSRFWWVYFFAFSTVLVYTKSCTVIGLPSLWKTVLCYMIQLD